MIRSFCAVLINDGFSLLFIPTVPKMSSYIIERKVSFQTVYTHTFRATSDGANTLCKSVL